MLWEALGRWGKEDLTCVNQLLKKFQLHGTPHPCSFIGARGPIFGGFGVWSGTGDECDICNSIRLVFMYAATGLPLWRLLRNGMANGLLVVFAVAPQ